MYFWIYIHFSFDHTWIYYLLKTRVKHRFWLNSERSNNNNNNTTKTTAMTVKHSSREKKIQNNCADGRENQISIYGFIVNTNSTKTACMTTEINYTGSKFRRPKRKTEKITTKIPPTNKAIESYSRTQNAFLSLSPYPALLAWHKQWIDFIYDFQHERYDSFTPGLRSI